MANIKMKSLISISLICLLGCNQTNLGSLLIENIEQQDTLSMYARFSDCGEWGGHVEGIYLTKKENMLWVHFYKDTVICGSPLSLNRRTVSEKSKELTSQNRNDIIKYIHSFIKASKREQDVISNASSIFTIISKDSILYFIDWSTEWNTFHELRDGIF